MSGPPEETKTTLLAGIRHLFRRYRTELVFIGKDALFLSSFCTFAGLSITLPAVLNDYPKFTYSDNKNLSIAAVPITQTIPILAMFAGFGWLSWVQDGRWAADQFRVAVVSLSVVLNVVMLYNTEEFFTQWNKAAARTFFSS